jgi:hypothetical protein
MMKTAVDFGTAPVIHPIGDQPIHGPLGLPKFEPPADSLKPFSFNDASFLLYPPFLRLVALDDQVPIARIHNEPVQFQAEPLRNFLIGKFHTR